jgi:hypothetical protein
MKYSSLRKGDICRIEEVKERKYFLTVNNPLKEG